MTRRTVLSALAAAPLARGAQSPKASVSEVRIISHDPQLYNGWPTVARTKAGMLFLAVSGGRESHVCPFGRVELLASNDGGKTWSWPQIVMDTPIDDRDAGVVEAANGALLVTTFTSLAYEREWNEKLSKADTEQAQRWRAVQSRTTQTERDNLLGTWMLSSLDGGLTWSAPYRVPVNSPHGPNLLADGRLLYAGKALWGPDGWVGVAESKDHGRSWRRLATIPARSSDSHAEYHELHMVEADNGTLITHIRNHSKTNERETLQTESTDGGKTWSMPHPIGVWGLPSHLVKLQDGRLVMSYGYRREPYGVQVRVSEDHGKSWSDSIALTEDGVRGDLGYPSTVQLDDGELVTVWYERMADSPNAVLRQARWRLS